MRYILIFLFIGIEFLGFSQAPAFINYQGIARDDKGAPKGNQAIALRFEILQGSSSGNVIYTEDQATGITTNSLGLFSTQIGKNANLATVNWSAGPYYLRVSMDMTGGATYVSLGSQAISSVPFALSAPAPSLSYSNNILSIGGNTIGITTAQQVSISAGSNVTVTGGPIYTISTASQTPQVFQTLALSANNASLGISGGNTIALPAGLPPSNVTSTSGIASVSSIGQNSFNVNVPAPSYNAASGVLSFGSNTTNVVPNLGLTSGILYVGPTSNSISLPAAVSVLGTGIATVTGGPAYMVNVPQPSLAISGNSLMISIVGGNSVTIPTAPTISATPGGIVSVSAGPNYAVTVPSPTYNGTVLTIGAVTTTIAPTVALTSGTLLTVGPLSNSVSLSALGPWRQGAGSVTLATASDNVAINTPGAPSAKLDISGGAAGLLSALKADNPNAANANPTADFSSSGVLGLRVINNNAGGVAGNFLSVGGIALTTQNNSASFPTFQAQNTNSTVGAYAGYFIGGFVSKGNSSGSGDFALKVQNSSATDLFTVRNDGNIGVGTNAPITRLDVQHNSAALSVARIMNQSVLGNSAIDFGDNSGTAKMTFGYANSSSAFAWSNNSYINTSNSNDLVIATQGVERMRVTSAGNIGIGTSSPVQKLDVQGSVKITDGSQANGKVFVSDATGLGTWRSSPAATSFGGLNISSVTVGTTTTVLGTGVISFTKVYPSTEVQIALYSTIYGGTFTGASFISFQIYVDGVPGSASSIHYFQTTGKQEYVPLRSFFSGLSVGSHTITIVAQTDVGTSSGVVVDSGGFGGKSF